MVYCHTMDFNIFNIQSKQYILILCFKMILCFEMIKFFPQIHLHQLSHLHLASELDSQGYSSTIILCYNINSTLVD